MGRSAAITRNTKETQISLYLELDGKGKAEIDTGIGFFDHMLNSFAKHGFFDLSLKVKGDLDVGIVMGQAIREALGEKEGIVRYGTKILPMDEALILCSLDLSGRPYYVQDVTLLTERIGTFETEMFHEFFYALPYSAGMNLHIRQITGSNSHHIVEGAFKAFAKALDEAVGVDPRIEGVLSAKGAL